MSSQSVSQEPRQKRQPRQPRRPRNHPTALDALVTGEVSPAPDAVAAALRYFTARIELNNATGLPRRLALTSALTGEGVTTLCVALGEIIATDFERSVCVVELNWMDGSSSAGSGTAGLAEVLSGVVQLDEAIDATTVDGLSCISSGQASAAHAHSLVRSAQLARVIDDVAARFDHVIFDLPAVCSTSDALALARLCDAVALVVRHGVTTEMQIQTALEELKGVVVLGVVLNRATTKTPRWLRNALPV